MGHIAVFVKGEDHEGLLDSHCFDEDNDEAPHQYDYWKLGGRYQNAFGNGSPFALVANLDIDRMDIPWAYITGDGEWHSEDLARDEMSPEWDEQVRGWLRSLDPSEILTVADVHI